MARFDGGDVPEMNSKGERLDMPTVVEAAIISRVKPMQKVLVVQAANRPPELRPSAVQTHGLAFANPDPDVLRTALPMSASELKDCFSVLCIDVCKDRDEMERLVKKAKPLQV